MELYCHLEALVGHLLFYSSILERLDAGEVVVGDGGYVLQLERRGYVKAGHWTPEAAVEHPEAVRQLHREFLRAGANVIQTFTFYCSEDKLEISGNVTNITGAQINDAACDLAREVANEGGALVAGCVSKTPCYVESHSETEVKAIFKKQMDNFLKKEIDFFIVEFVDHVEEAVWAVEVMKSSGKTVAATLCISPHGDKNGVPPGECAVRLVRAGAEIVGINCHLDPLTCVRTVKLMKEGLEKAGLKAHLMVQPLGCHTPECNFGGYTSLPEYPFALETRAVTRWDIHKYAREAYNAEDFATSVAAVDLRPTTSELSQKSWLQREDSSHQLQRSTDSGELLWRCTPNPGSEPGPFLNPCRIYPPEFFPISLSHLSSLSLSFSLTFCLSVSVREFLRAGTNVIQTFTFYCCEDKLEISGNVTNITGAQINNAACDLASYKSSHDQASCDFLWYNDRTEEKPQVPPRFELGSLDSESRVLTITPWNRCNLDVMKIKLTWRGRWPMRAMRWWLGVFLRLPVMRQAEVRLRSKPSLRNRWMIQFLHSRVLRACGRGRVGSGGDEEQRQNSGCNTVHLPSWRHAPVPPGECAVRLVRAGAEIVGINCHLDPLTCVRTVKLMKEGLEKAGLKAHLMVQPLGFHTPECNHTGYLALPEFPFVLETRAVTRWDIHKYAREAYNARICYIGGCCGFEAYHIRAIAEELAAERGFLPPASEKHGLWGAALEMHTKPWVRARAHQEYWENLLPTSGRLKCPSMAAPATE
ncbi:hypothetical protein L3Q82_023357 [Scortum barcoo]|uniref:Uncharacterized protein n=1 Tax=Scortum barcoo TaxID=214431 RepID=A0ACB8WY12_9TELE|nr:hypothetical protein L3Q82_023357 [Scortum barcoo]